MDTHTRHVAAVTDWLTLEVGFVSDMGPEALYKAVIESLKNTGVLGEAGVVYIRGSGPGILRGAIDLFVPDTDEPEEEVPQAIVADLPVETQAKQEDPTCAGCSIALTQFALHDENCERPPPTDARQKRERQSTTISEGEAEARAMEQAGG